MVDTRAMVVCVERQARRYQDSDPAKCTDADHDYQLFEQLPRHRSMVVLPNA